MQTGWKRRSGCAGTALALVLALAALPASAEPAAEPGARAEAAIDPAKEAAIRAYLEVSGSVQLGRQMGQAIMLQLQPAYPQVPQELWRELSASLDSDELIEMLVPVYDRHFSKEEIDGLVEFYSSPIGRSVVQKMPAAVHEGMTIGNVWGQQKAGELIEKLAAKGYQPVEL